MTSSKKLSTYLNRYYSYHKIKDAEFDQILDITFEYIQSAEDKIFKQPAIALRAIKVEMIDILIHHDRYVKELEGYVNELNALVSKGPRLDDRNLEKLKVVEDKRNVLVEFVYLIEDSLAYITRMLLEHYSELDKDKLFLDKFSKYLGSFDWMRNRAERYRNELIMKIDNDPKPVPFEREIIIKSKQMIADDKVELALDLLLSNVQDQTLEKDLVLLKQQWINVNKEKDLGLISEESSRVSMAKIAHGVLSII
ncbi:MAG: hypothetical protein IPI11_02975 [Haliscomenobacter sp.]|nr:hypothetical protein [Haliscomenobacter sp.]